jgi:hypothetical protein
MTRDLGDGRYFNKYFLTLQSDITDNAGTAYVLSNETVTLPVGTYAVTGLIRGIINSATAGITMGVTKIASETGHGIGRCDADVWASDTYNTGPAAGTFLGASHRGNSNGVDNFSVIFTDSASRRTLQGTITGSLVLTAPRTLCFFIQQRTAVDAANPATLVSSVSWVCFTKIK